jgi:hypothetical protein
MVDSDPINTTNLTCWSVHSELRLLIIYFYIFRILLPPLLKALNRAKGPVQRFRGLCANISCLWPASLLGGVKHTNSIINRTI